MIVYNLFNVYTSILLISTFIINLISYYYVFIYEKFKEIDGLISVPHAGSETGTC